MTYVQDMTTAHSLLMGWGSSPMDMVYNAELLYETPIHYVKPTN